MWRVLKNVPELLCIQLHQYGKNEEEEYPPGMHEFHEAEANSNRAKTKQFSPF